MFHHKRVIVIVVLVILFCILSFGIYRSYCDNKLNKYVKKIDINSFENNYLIVEKNDGDIEVSIDVIVFKLELEKCVYDIDDKIRVEYLILERYSKVIKIKYKYNHSYKVIEYTLEKGIDKNNDLELIK